MFLEGAGCPEVAGVECWNMFVGRSQTWVIKPSRAKRELRGDHGEMREEGKGWGW